MRRTRALFCAAVAALAVSGCAAPRSAVRVDRVEGPLPNCDRIAWLSAANTASLTEQRVRAAALAQLQKKGYTVVEDKPDCRLTYVMATSEQPRARPSVGVGAGGGSHGIGGGIGISLPIGHRDRYSGTFTIDVVDATTNAQAWSGSIDASFDAAELTPEEANQAVETVLAQFPDRAQR
jgi:uncharacterized protein DUF4136